MNKRLRAEFASPPSAYRGKPFWAWNGKLEEEELRRQIRIMKRMGLGGFFMHSRVGLDTAYLGEEWFKCVNACVDEADKLGMEAWLYDEDRWPSGAAGGLVTRNSKYRMRHLELQKIDTPADFKWSPDILAAFAARIEGPHASSVRRVSKATLKADRASMAPGESILVFRVVVDKSNPWYNGYTYLDTLSAEAVAQFIRVTHEAYRKRIGKHFGKLVPGIFTDEPNYGHATANARPWTQKLPAVFRERYGYEILDHLVALFFDVDGVVIDRARLHYHDCITHLFVTNFTRQIGEWCGKHNLFFTGHMLMEDTLRSQTAVVGACMRHYEYMQAPGMDLLTEHWRIYLCAKQLSSAARQFGWKWRLSEIYGCTGWDFPFEGHKALGDWQAATGINLRCQHLSWYTMLAQAKRDYPAAIFYQSPWWEYYNTVEDYFARIGAVMTRGQEVRDLLVIHPIESMWAMSRSGWGAEEDMKGYDQSILDLSNSLLSEQVDFDWGDEELLSRHARVMMTDGGATLKVGKAVYKAVLVPPLKTMRSSTLSLLKKFAAAGGAVVFAGDIAAHLDGAASSAVVEFANSCAQAADQGKALAEAVGKCRRIRITGAAGEALSPVIYLLREDKENCYLFVANTSHLPRNQDKDLLTRDRAEAFGDVRIRGFGECLGNPLELDPSTGKIHAAAASRTGEGWEIRTSLPRIGSRLYVIPRSAGGIDAVAPVTLTDVRREVLGDGAWDIILSEPNCLVLDRPRYKIGKGEWQSATEVLRVDKAVREALGVPARGGSMVQPWAREKPAHPRATTVQLSYVLDLRSLPSGGLQLGIEQPQRFQIAINGHPVDTDADCGWWTDRSLRTLPVDPAVLKIGANQIDLVCRFDETFSGLEIMYLLGNFGTTLTGTDVAITAVPATLRLGDWVEQGLTFYGGSVAYRRTISPAAGAGQRLFVRLGDYRGVAVRVLVDGKSAGVIGWDPKEVDITDLISGPTAELAIEVLGHRRNSHGPLHLNEKWPAWTGPGEFVASGDRWVEGYQLVPCGLMSSPQLVVKQEA